MCQCNRTFVDLDQSPAEIDADTNGRDYSDVRATLVWLYPLTPQYRLIGTFIKVWLAPHYIRPGTSHLTLPTVCLNK
jgi:hypothetical protein